VLLGRVLELVCEDRGAKGKSLDARLKFLAKEGIIPKNLAEVAHGLRHLRNVGAHPALGELTPAEIPILDDLTRAILTYVYSAPILGRRAIERADWLKRQRSSIAEGGGAV
jgi:hypothetical protein